MGLLIFNPFSYFLNLILCLGLYLLLVYLEVKVYTVYSLYMSLYYIHYVHNL